MWNDSVLTSYLIDLGLFSCYIAHIDSVKISKSTGKNGRPIKWGSSCWAQRCFQSKAVEGLGTI